MMNEFKKYMLEDGKSENTMNSYIQHINGFLKWYKESFGEEFKKMYRANVLDYISYMTNILKQKPKTINAKVAALIKLNEFLQEQGIQDNIVVSKKDNIKIQNQIANPTDITKQEVEAFRQKILENETKRDYAIITIMAYAGLRISEVLNIRMSDFNITTREIIVSQGKGKKHRIVYMNDKIVNAIKEYLKDRESKSDYLFVSRQDERVNRTRINQICNKHSNKITPHKLRHFFCTVALESGYSIHEVANQAGHSNIHTTLMYTNPTAEVMKEKANRL